MTKLKETLLKKYSVWEYLIMAMGILVGINPVWYFIKVDFEKASWHAIGIAVFVLLLSVLLIARPLAIMDYGRKKFGLKTREEKFEKDDQQSND